MEIRQFMWGYQPHFRTSLEGAAKSAFDAIGLHVAPRAYLVGLRATPDAAFDVCIEPETGPFEQRDLASLLADAERRYYDDPERAIFHSDRGLHDRRQAQLLDRHTADAVAAALTAAPGGAGRHFFAGYGQRIGDYQVYPVFSVLVSRWDAEPALETELFERRAIDRSLQHGVLRQVLVAGSRAMFGRQPPHTVLGDGESRELVDRAADMLGYDLAWLTGEFFGSGLRAGLDAVAAQPYEGRSGAGSLVIVNPRNPHLRIDVRFDKTVAIRDTRALRKTLEMSTSDLSLLSDGESVFGLGAVLSSYSPEAEDCFEVSVLGRGLWQVSHSGTVLMRVVNGRAQLPRERLKREQFADTVERLFPGSTAENEQILWDLTQACVRQAHGTMLVVHPAAADEGRRLVPQAQTISPTLLSGSILEAMTNIDGAVLVSPDGLSHAVGVILDGVATGTGDASRGARYNSAVRYLAGPGEGALVIIVSEDGMVDLRPDLKRRVSRARVQEALEAFISATEGEIDFEELSRRDEQLSSLGFYLSAEQCDAANASREVAEEYRKTRSNVWPVYPPRQPDPEMNDSYFLN